MRQLIAALVLVVGMLGAHAAAAESVDLELVLLADASRSFSFRYLEPMTLVGVFFLAMSLIASLLNQRVERWLAYLAPRLEGA